MESNKQNKFITKGKKIGIMVLTNICILLSLIVWYFSLLTMPSFIFAFQCMDLELPFLTKIIILFARFSRTIPGFIVLMAVPALLFLVHLITSVIMSLRDEDNFDKKFATFEVSLTYIAFIFIMVYVIFFNIAVTLPFIRLFSQLH